MAPPQKLNFITGNKNKLAEVKAILGTAAELDSRAVDVPEIQGTPNEIAIEKSRRAAEVVSTTTNWNLHFSVIVDRQIVTEIETCLLVSTTYDV